MKIQGLRGPLLAFAAAGAMFLSACGLPKRVTPPALEREAPLGHLQAVSGTWPVPKWWNAYHDPQLGELIALAMRSTPDLALANARVQNADSAMRAVAAQGGFSVDGSVQWSRQRLSENGVLPTQLLGITWYGQSDIGLQLRYEVDWWGKKRALVKAAMGELAAAAAQAGAATLTIQHAVADTYFAWQADQGRLALARDQLGDQQRLTEIAELRVRQGVDIPDEAQTARAQLAAISEQVAALQGSAQVRLAGLAALVGVPMDQLPSLTPRALPEVAQGLPADASLDLLARRPDVAASRWQVQAALDQTDAARAEFLPDLNLTAMAGLSSIEMARLFDGGSRVFALTPALHLPIFSAGLLKANYGVRRAQLEAAIASYRSTVLTAVREVATQALSAQTLVERRREQQAQLATAQRLQASALSRVQRGVSDEREVLAAQSRLLTQRDSALQVHALALTTDLALVKALGGGYRDASAASSPSSNSSSGASSR
jgi:multidrug efflux system outer membrane protein